jgi:hypothetical protein
VIARTADDFPVNGTIDRDELKDLLKDAGVGCGLTRWAWAKGIMGEPNTSSAAEAVTGVLRRG